MANNQPPTTPTRYPLLSNIGHLSLLGPVAAALIGSLFLRLSGAAASASIALYLRGLSDAGQAISPLLVGMLAATFFIVELFYFSVPVVQTDWRTGGRSRDYQNFSDG